MNKNILKHSMLAAFIGIMLFIGGNAFAQSNDKMMSDKKSDMMNDNMSMNKTMMYHVPAKPEDISPLLDGEKIPMVNIPDAMGKNFDLNAAVAAKPTILVFYRGGWCPYCSKQLSGLQDIHQDLENMGYQLIAISTDSPDNLSKTAMKESLNFTLLSDADLSVAKQFGLAYKAPAAYDKILPNSSGGKNTGNLLPVPSVFILDKKGDIQFEYINPDFMQRLSPDLLKAAAQTLYKNL
ncbi:antioxidant AhpC [Arachidicoccus ginsenosidimutans]|uniref:peroxiredoxin-like family protein n=1 Tax=Arachidicoccus sp. BS20 TaxID=1850526 RepID=UPI0007F0F76E|nr:peroxiredoxin-like family protein [Arachidicoccus sp. BS20]ANI89593.1 antioxidant AhpC [Arachidicoccus sp. BS20]